MPEATTTQPATTTEPSGLLGPTATDPKAAVDPAAVLFAAADAAKPEAPESPKADAPATDAPADDKSLLGEEKADEAKPAAPEYKFDFPTGYEPNEASVASFKTLISGMAEGKGLSQADANALIKFDADTQVAREKGISDQWENTRKEWREQVKLDPEIGGDKLKAEVLPRINKMLVAATGTPGALKEFKQQLDATGMGDHPVVIRTLNKLALALTEGSAVAAGGPVGQKRSVADVLFGSKPN